MRLRLRNLSSYELTRESDLSFQNRNNRHGTTAWLRVTQSVHSWFKKLWATRGPGKMY